MPLIIEDGSGVASANSYTNENFALAYLTDRNRETENTWSTKTAIQRQAALISATDYIEGEFGLKFMGRKAFAHLTHAKGVYTLTANPTDGQAVVIGSVTYTFKDILGADKTVKIGANASISLANLIIVINSGDPDVIAGEFIDDSFVASARLSGPAGNLITTTTDVTGATWSNAALKGGATPGSPQPLSFPRSGLRDYNGSAIQGMPIPLKQACVEYAVRAVANSLLPDPEDGAGSIIRRKDKVGVLEEDISYSEGHLNKQIRKSYPMADKLLQQYLGLYGGTIL